MTDHSVQQTINIRPVRPEDVRDIHEMIAKIYGEYGYILDVAHDEAEAHLRRPGPYFRSKDGEFWVAVEGGQIIGSVAVLMKEGVAELKSLYVHPNFRRRGLGRRLVNHVIGYVRQKGVPQLTLWSDTSFKDAHRLYTTMDFRQTGIRDLHDFNNSREYGFVMDLS